MKPLRLPSRPFGALVLVIAIAISTLMFWESVGSLARGRGDGEKAAGAQSDLSPDLRKSTRSRGDADGEAELRRLIPNREQLEGPNGSDYREFLTGWFRDDPRAAIQAALKNESRLLMADLLVIGSAAFIKDPSLFNIMSDQLSPSELAMCHLEFFEENDRGLFLSLLESAKGNDKAREAMLTILPDRRYYLKLPDLLHGTRDWADEHASPFISAILSEGPEPDLDRDTYQKLVGMNLTQPAMDSLFASYLLAESAKSETIDIGVLSKDPDRVTVGAVDWYSKRSADRFGWAAYLEEVMGSGQIDPAVKIAALKSATEDDARAHVMDLVQVGELDSIEGLQGLVTDLTRKLLNDDAIRASKWIGTLPAGRSKDAAITVLLDYLLRNGEHESYQEWAALMGQ